MPEQLNKNVFVSWKLKNFFSISCIESYSRAKYFVLGGNNCGSFQSGMGSNSIKGEGSIKELAISSITHAVAMVRWNSPITALDAYLRFLKR